MASGLCGLLLGCSLMTATAAAAPAQVQLQDARSGEVHSLSLSAGSTELNRLKKSWSWYVSRASGILAAILLALLVLSGVGLLTGQTYRILEPLPAWAAHRAVGLAFGAMTLIHISVLLFDKFIGFDLADLLIPFASDYKPLMIGGLELGSMYLALGILAFYAIIIIIASSLYWINSQPKRWQLLHYLSYAVLAMVFIHGLFLGTDLQGGLARVLWVAGGLALLAAIGLRLQRANTIGKGR